MPECGGCDREISNADDDATLGLCGICARQADARLAKLVAERDKAEARLVKVRQALRWILHIECGIGKGGKEPEEGEREAALKAGQAVLEEKEERM